MRIWPIRPLLPLEAAKAVAAPVVGSRLDYCNSLLWQDRAELSCLQRVQFTLALNFQALSSVNAPDLIQ